MTFDPKRPPVPEHLVLPMGGTLRTEPEDFIVEEIPLYEASGEGEWMMLLIEKRDMTTPFLIRQIGNRLGVSHRDIGWAGYKDRHAITRQWLTVPARAYDGVGADGLRGDGFEVLEASRHGNKLKTGHLWGNRFRIRVRGAELRDHERVSAHLDRVVAEGLPNGYGPQRFGTFGRNHLVGGAIVGGKGQELLDLLGEEVSGESPRVAEGRLALRSGHFDEAGRVFPRDFDVERHVARVLGTGGDADTALRTLPRRGRDILMSAWQAACFNTVLAARQRDGRLLVEGDLAMKLPRGGTFVVEDLTTDLERASRLEIAATGPIPGRKMPSPVGEAGVCEEAALEEMGVPDDVPHLRRNVFLGARRPLRVGLQGASVAVEDCGFGFTFELPSGCFATSVLALFGVADAS